MKLKLLTLSLSLLLCLLSLPSLALGAELPVTVKLYLNDKLLQPETAPQLINGNTLVPVRIIAEQLGAVVSWEDKTRKVSVRKDDLSIELAIDNKTAYVKGVKETLEVAPVIVKDNTLVPLRFIGEKLGTKFTWDQLTKSVHMFKQDAPAGPEPKPDPDAPSIPAQPDKQPGQVTDPALKNVNLVQSIELTDTDFIVKTNGGEIKPSVFKLSNPNRIVFDLPNSTLDEPMKKLLVGTTGEIASKHPLVQKARFSNYSITPASVRVTLDLKDTADYKIVPPNQSNVLKVSLHEPGFKVVIDAGHGDQDPGALSVTGKHEKDFTLAMAKKVRALLSQDKRIEVLTTRNDDTFLELNDRVSFANNQQADLFLSIHGNKFKPEVRGVETYYSRAESLAFANLIHKYTVNATGFPDRRVRQEDFRVIKYTNMPAVLVEVGYLSNKTDEASMFNASFQDQVAASLVSAIKEYLNIE